MTSELTLKQLMENGEDDAMALAAPAMAPLTFAGLRSQMSYTLDALNRVGIGQNDRVAIVLPNGPLMATTFLGVAAGATAAPLNPAYREDEFRFFLSDLRAKALIVAEGANTTAISIAAQLNIPNIFLSVQSQGDAGRFTLDTVALPTATPQRAGFGTPD